MSDIVWAGICAVAFAFGAVCLFLRLNITAAEADALADAIIASRKTSGTKNLRSYRIGQLLERHGWFNAVQRRESELFGLRITDDEREALDKMRVHLYEISRDNAFIDEVCDDAKAACAAITAFLERHKQPQNTQDQQPRTKEAAHMSDENERSVASAGSVEPVAWGVANRNGLLATSIQEIDAVDMQSEFAFETEIVPLYRSPPCQDFSQKT